MTDYNIIPAVDENYNFPPQIQRNIASYPEFLEVRERLGDSETQLIAYSKELIQSRELIASVDSDLTRVKEVTIPQAVKTLEAVDQQAAIELEALNGQLVSAEGEISSAKGRVEVLEGQIVDEQRERDELAQSTQQTFQQLNSRLETFHDDEALLPIRNELIAAKDAVEAAQETANAASTAAESANSALLQMAGILDSKGRTLYQSTPPGPEDQSTSNLWIIPDTGQAHAWDDIAKEWVPFEDSGIKEAAQNAAAANSKAVAAQQTADTAIANASRAQAAAEAAQRTADTATTDAREAHNEAVAAQEAADEALGLYGPLDQRTIDAQAAAATAQARADAAYAEAASKATPAQVTAAAKAAEQAAKTAAASDAKAKADAAQAEATRLAALDAKAKADAAQAEATRIANTKATPAEVKAAADNAERLAKEAAALDATAKADAAKAAAALDAKAKADAALAAARKDLATARTQITAEIKASANGKNAITISTSAPTSSAPGVVAGDTWWRVDGSGNIFGQWVWNGSWVPRQIRSEVIANLDVHKLQVTGDAKMAQAVIDKLWVDGLAAKTIETQRLTVSTGNLIPDGTELLSDTQWGAMRRDTVDKPMSLPAARWADYPFSGITSIGNTPFTVSPGVEYVVETWIKADKPNSRFYMELRTANSGAHGGSGKLETPTAKSTSSYVLFNNETVPTEWTLYRGTWTPNEGVTEVRFGTFYFNHASGTEKTASIGLAGFSMRPKVGAVLIEDGAVSADKISASKELSAKVGQFIEVETSSLVATKDITTPQAVINKLWADGISTKSLTTSYLAVASSNLLANGNAESDAFWNTEALPRVEITDLPGFSHAFHASEETYKVENPYRGPYSENQDSALFPVVPGETYLFEMWVKASVEGSRFMAWFLDADSNMASTGNKIVSPVKQSLGSTLMYIYSVPTQWTKYQAEITIKPGITSAQLGNFVFNYLSPSTGVYADVWVTGLSLKPMVGSTLIAPGSITTDKITVTEELSTNIANAMTVNTKELIVSEGATLNNAKVIGNLWAENFAAGKITTEMFSTSAAFSGPGVTINRTGINIGDKIYMNASSGFYALNSAGRRTFEISPTGTAKFSGEVTSSAEITGAYIRTGTSGARLEMVGTTLKAFNSSNLETFRVNSEGSTYWYGSRKIGRIGESYKKGNTSVRGLVNHLETTGDYISWAYLEKPTDTEFTSMMTLDPKGRFYGHSGGGLYIETGLKAHNTGWNPSWSGFEVSVVTIAGNNLPAIKWGSTYLAFSTGAMYAVTNGTYYRIDKS